VGLWVLFARRRGYGVRGTRPRGRGVREKRRGPLRQSSRVAQSGSYGLSEIVFNLLDRRGNTNG
jgi:hypothetical protein